MKQLVKTLCCCGLLIFNVSCWAHAPHFERDDMSISSPFVIDWQLDKSIAIYAHFSNATDVDVVSFIIHQSDIDQNAPIPLHVSSLVPACTPYQKLLPTLAIVGPRQAALSDAPDGKVLPFQLGEDQGLHLITNAQQGKRWYEPFGGKSYYKQNAADLGLSSAGQYFLYIWTADGMTGDYVFEIGTKEQFNLGDIFRSFYLVPRLWWDGEITDPQCQPAGRESE